jgi:selenocysteine lyase/cysteine desulfurase
VGAVALAAACRASLDLGMETVAAHEQALSAQLWSALADIPGLQTLTLWPDGLDRVGVATLNLDGWHDIDRLIDALREIAATGPRSRYLHSDGLDEYDPEPPGVLER